MTRRNFLILLLVFLAVLIVGAAGGAGIYYIFPSYRQPDEFASLFNDFLSPIFAALAFGGLIYTVILQSEELAEQRRAIKDQTGQLEAAAHASERTAEALKEQAEHAKHTARVNALREFLDFVDETVKEMQIRERYGPNSERTEHIEQMKAKRFEAFNRLLKEIMKYTADEVTDERSTEDDS